jgi:arginine exporter protein ArgO
MRGIYINSLLMSIAYVVPLGVFPVYVFGKNVTQNDETDSLEITPKDNQDQKPDK